MYKGLIINRCYLISIMLLALFSCTNRTSVGSHSDIQNTTNQTVVHDYQNGDVNASYLFVDSTNVGQKGKYKITVEGLIDGAKMDLKMNLSEKTPTGWKTVQEITETVLDLSDPDIELADINNDGFMDLRFKNMLAGNGYNELRKHYVFDKSNMQLKPITNSDNYPNLYYDPDLDCVVSYAVSGGYSSTFLVLEADSLREFASIVLSDNQRTVSTRNKQGVITILDKSDYNLDRPDADLTYGQYNYLSLKKYKNK